MPGIQYWNGENSRDRENFLHIPPACGCVGTPSKALGSGWVQKLMSDQPLAPCARTRTLLPAPLRPWEGEGSLCPKPCFALQVPQLGPVRSWHCPPRAAGQPGLVGQAQMGVPGNTWGFSNSRCFFGPAGSCCNS